MFMYRNRRRLHFLPPIVKRCRWWSIKVSDSEKKPYNHLNYKVKIASAADEEHTWLADVGCSLSVNQLFQKSLAAQAAVAFFVSLHGGGVCLPCCPAAVRWGGAYGALNGAQMCSVEVLIGASDQENGAALRGKCSGTDRKKTQVHVVD